MATATHNSNPQPANGDRRIVDSIEYVYYDGYWIRYYAPLDDTLANRKRLIDSLTRRAIKWRKNGTKKLLPPLPDDDYSIALSINRHGVVLGYSYRESGTKFIKTIVTWNRKGVPTAHRQLRGFERLDNLGDINEKGEFVGTQFRFDDPQIDKSTRMGTIWY